MPGCNDVACLDGDRDCVLPSPCSRLRFECEDGRVRIRRLKSGDALVGGTSALASVGDYVLENDRVRAVIDALDHPHYLAPTGGVLLDLVVVGDEHDSLNQVLHATGLLPGDAARYESARVFEDEGFAALQVLGRLDEHPDQIVATRYEIRPCEPGIRVRTQIINGEADPAVWALMDGWYWGGKSQLPFLPRRGSGFEYPELDIESATDAFIQVPWMASLPHLRPSTGYLCVPCNLAEFSGFHDEDISTLGTPPRVVPPRDFEVLERFIGAVSADSVAPAVDMALELRRQLHGDPWAVLEGKVTREDGNELGTEALASVRVFEGNEQTDPSRRIATTQVTPDRQGRFSVRVPAERDYVLQVESFGRPAANAIVHDARATVTVPEMHVESPATLQVAVEVDGEPSDALVFVEPADTATEKRVSAERFGHFGTCAPLLGPPHGTSPACNRFLVNGEQEVQLPAGNYHAYATAGPFKTIARRRIRLGAGETDRVELSLQSLQLQPEGTLSADFHVHGAASFDASIPDLDRVRSFVAARVQVVAVTDHDVVHDYSAAVDELGVADRIVVIPGVETTGHILFKYVPGEDEPRVIGHWNFWPLEPVADAPWRGAPWDELAEPGELFERVEQAGWPRDHGVIQLNHPWSKADFGRDAAFPRAIDLDLDRPLPPEYDGTRQSLFHRIPEGAEHRNSDYHVQEVMNGSDNARHRAYRDFWFYLLDQGVVRAGTANSDSHGLSDSVMGSPRTLVWTDTEQTDFDLATFDRAVRDGRMLGTNGPVIELELLQGEERARPSTEPVRPKPGARLQIRVSAAPWVPVESVRLIVNGRTARTFDDDLKHPEDPFGSDGLLRLERTIELDDVIDGGDADSWLLVEAGARLPDSSEAAAPDASASEEPRDREAPDYHYQVVVPDGYPAAFTNPLLFDRDGGGFGGVR